VTDGGDSLFERVGGQGWFDDLVERFYVEVAADPVLRPLYPDDLRPGMRHLALFLGQYWGGPDAYSQERGHPRLRARHLPFAIGTAERDAWVRHMVAAVAGAELGADDRQAIVGYFEETATFLINQSPLSLRPS
jgi:hemoglobin